MVLIHLAQDWLSGGIPPVSDLLAWSHFHLFPSDWSFLAQQFETDVFADTRSFFNNFVQSGQIWALIIGFVLGWLFRSLTSYG